MVVLAVVIFGPHEGQKVSRELRLQRRLFEEVVEHDRRVGIALELDDHAHAVPVALVAEIGDALEFLVVDHGGDFLQQRRLVDLVGQLGDNDGGAGLRVFLVLFFLEVGDGLQGDAAVSLALR